MIPRLAITLLLVLTLLPGLAVAEDSADRRRRTDQARRTEQRLRGAAVDVRMIGFVDLDPKQNCGDAGTDELPCVEAVAYAAPPQAGLASVQRRSSLFAEKEQALVGRLLFWGLSDLAYRTTRPATAATISLDRGLWERGAVRLPSAEALWTGVDYRPKKHLRWSASTAAPEPWIWRGTGSQSLCVPVRYQGAHDVGVQIDGATRPRSLVCVDGFVTNFADAIGNHFPGQLFRMGRVEGGKRSRRTGEPDKGEQLLTEYLFVSGRHDAAPWSTRQLRDGSTRGVFETAQVAKPGGGASEELFVNPRKLLHGAGGTSDDGDEEAQAGPSLPDWVSEFDPETLPTALDRGMERFLDQIGVRILGHATLEYNPTHVRTLTALAALRSPPPPLTNAQESTGLLVGPNAGHRDRSVFGAATEDEARAPSGWTGGSLSGDIGAQTSKLPNELRWQWIQRLLLKHAAGAEPNGLPHRGEKALYDCPTEACPDLKSRDPATTGLTRWQAYDALRQLVRARGADLAPEELATVIDTVRRESTTEEAEDMSEQLLELLMDQARVHPGRLLLDHVLSELSNTLNAGSVWEAAALEAEATAVFEGVLDDHGYPTVPLKIRGEPANPLAVCSDRAAEGSGIRAIELDVLFEGSAQLRHTLESARRAGATSDDGGAAVRAATWAILQEAARTLPFVVVDAPGRNPPTVEPIFLLPGDQEGGDRAIYRARWRVWAGWHLMWGISHERFAAANAVGDAQRWIEGDGLVLRSGALCDDTTFVAADVEATLLRASLLRGFAPSILPRRAAAKPPPAQPEAPGSLEDVGEGAEEALGEANAAADTVASEAAAVLGAIPTEMPSDTSSVQGLLDKFNAEPPPDETTDEGPDTPAGDVRKVMLRRLQSHPSLTCPTRRDAGTLRDDADLDGRSELYGDCDDTSAEFIASRGPQLFLVFDLHGGRSPTPPGYARSPYLSLSSRRLSGSVFAVSTVRDPDDALTARHLLPDHRPLVARGGRWARRKTVELTLGFEGGWSPLDVLSAKCDPKYDGPPSVTCVRDASNELINRERSSEDFTRVGVHAGMQVLATTWDTRYQRTGFDAGAELGLNVTLPAIYGRSSLQRIALVRPRVAAVFGVRALLLPALRQPPGPAPWGATRGSAGGPRFGRAVFALRTGWSVTALPQAVEGGPLLEITLGPAVRSLAGAFGAVTPYRPRMVLSGFIRGDAAFKIATIETRLTFVNYRVTATFGVHASFAVGAKMAKEPEAPDLSGFEKLRDLVNNPPSLPGGG